MYIYNNYICVHKPILRVVDSLTLQKDALKCPASGVADQRQPSTRAGGAVQRPWPQSRRSGFPQGSGILGLKKGCDSPKVGISTVFYGKFDFWFTKSYVVSLWKLLFDPKQKYDAPKKYVGGQHDRFNCPVSTVAGDEAVDWLVFPWVFSLNRRSLELTQTSLAAPLGGRTFVESPCPIHEKNRCFVLRTLLLCRVFSTKNRQIYISTLWL